MIEVKRIDDHGLKVSIRLNGRSTQYFTELAAIKLRDKLIAVLSPIPPAPDLLALLKRCKPWLEERRAEAKNGIEGILEDIEDWEQSSGYRGVVEMERKAIAELDALISDIEKMEAEK